MPLPRPHLPSGPSQEILSVSEGGQRAVGATAREAVQLPERQEDSGRRGGSPPLQSPGHEGNVT